MEQQPPKVYDTLMDTISNRHDSLSRRLKQIANFALEHPTTMGIETIANIAQSAEVQPSALIRFAKTFGYKGFSDMQRIFQRYVTEQSESYKERVTRELAESGHGDADSPQALFRQFCHANIVALKHLEKGVDPSSIDKAIALLKKARSVYVVGQRRSHPIATYLSYALSHADCRTHLIDGSGGLLKEQAKAIGKEDLLIAISFHPYSSETTQVANIAAATKAPCLAITDSSVSPIADLATVMFNIQEAEVHNFRSLSASMLVAQTLATGLVIDGNQ